MTPEITVKSGLKEEKDSLERRLTDKKSVFEFLRGRGYNVSEFNKIGEGNTREVYLATYESGGVRQKRVIKIPKDGADTQSLCTLVNTGRRDVNAREVETANLTSFKHDNIVNILDGFKYEGKTITAEEYVEGQSLESLAALNPLSVEAITKVYIPVCKAIGYLHDEDILHRDIKPSNILVEKEKYNGTPRVKVTDLQNAARIADIRRAALPTRGGTSCTHPLLLNSIISGLENNATKRTDIYAIGASIFESATGEKVFDYKLEFDDQGTEVDINGEIHRVSLRDGDKKIKLIDDESHELRLKKQLKKLPQKLRKPVYRALTLNPKQQYYNVGSLEKDLMHTEKSWARKFGEKVLRAVKPTLIGAGVGLGLGIVLYGMSLRDPETKPTMTDILRNVGYGNFDLSLDLDGKKDFMSEAEANHRLDILHPYIKKVKKELPAKMSEIVRTNIFGGEFTREDDISFVIDSRATMECMDKRMVGAWIRGLYMLDQEKVNEVFGAKNGNPNRLPPSYVPRSFVDPNRGIYDDTWSDDPAYHFGLMYLKQALIGEKDIPGAIARYFTTDEERAAAILRTGSMKYFPKYDPMGVSDTLPEAVRDSLAKGASLEVGYAQALPREKVDIINTILATYALTDKDGNLDTSKTYEMDFLRGEYNQRLSLPPK